MPMDAPLNTSCAPSQNGTRSSSRKRSATLRASAALWTSSSRMVNSSPLSRGPSFSTVRWCTSRWTNSPSRRTARTTYGSADPVFERTSGRSGGWMNWRNEPPTSSSAVQPTISAARAFSQTMRSPESTYRPARQWSSRRGRWSGSIASTRRYRQNTGGPQRDLIPPPGLLGSGGARLLLRHVRGATSTGTPVPDAEVPPGAGPPGCRGSAGARGTGGIAVDRPRIPVARAHPGVPGRGLLRNTRARGPAQARVLLERGAGRAIAGERLRHRGGGPRRAQRGGLRQPVWRHPPRLGKLRKRLLRLQRHRRRRTRAAARGTDRSSAGRGPRRAPGRRDGGDLRRRRERLHLLDARGEELPLPEAALFTGRRAARWLSRF